MYIYGVVCDTCGVVDAVDSTESSAEDKLPRDGWISINLWEESESLKIASPFAEYHTCSVKCLNDLSIKLTDSNVNIDQEENHSH